MTRAVARALAVAATMMAVGPARADEAEVATAYDVFGTVLVETGGAPARRLLVGDALSSSARIRVDGGALARLATGSELVLVRGPSMVLVRDLADGRGDAARSDLAAAVRVAVVSLPARTSLRAGASVPSDPFSPGLDLSGEVCATGPDILIGGSGEAGMDAIEIESTQDGASAEAAPEGAGWRWPPDLPPRDGGSYRLRSGKEARTWRLWLRPSAREGATDTLRWLVERGCHAQARAWLARLPADRTVGP